MKIDKWNKIRKQTKKEEAGEGKIFNGKQSEEEWKENSNNEGERGWW